jgi:hypothetical protein
VSETAVALDVVDAGVSSLLAIFETIALIDSLTNTLTSQNSVASTFTLDDFITPAGSVFLVQIGETITITDSVFGKLLLNLIDDSQTPSWQNIDDSDAVTWNAISTAQTPGWTQINDSETPGWTDINDAQNPNWVKI